MMEPYRIKVVEPLIRVSRRMRERALEKAGYNPFQISADCVSIDLISDSGTCAMSAEQWAAMMQAREDFSGRTAYREFVNTARTLFGLPCVQPVHQGRVAENILFKLLLRRKKVVFGNTHFLTTRENVAAAGGHTVDLPAASPPFCGDIDLEALERRLKAHDAAAVILTLTSNVHGGQPVSLAAMRAVRRLTRTFRIPLLFDASRFAGNTYLLRELTRSKKNLRSLCKQQFDLCDTAYMSCKKDGLANIGGCIMTRSKAFFHQITQEIIRQESFPDAGGLAARDLAAMSIGLKHSLDARFLRSHIESIRYCAARLQEKRVPVFLPVGAHAVTILPALKDRYAAFSLAATVFLHSGIRGGVFGNGYRLAIPRRVYTREHLDHVADMVSRAYHGELLRLRCVFRPRRFFTFFVRFTLRSSRRT